MIQRSFLHKTDLVDVVQVRFRCGFLCCYLQLYPCFTTICIYSFNHRNYKKKKNLPLPKTNQLVLGNVLKQQLVKEHINNAGW